MKNAICTEHAQKEENRAAQKVNPRRKPHRVFRSRTLTACKMQKWTRRDRWSIVSTICCATLRYRLVSVKTKMKISSKLEIISIFIAGIGSYPIFLMSGNYFYRRQDKFVPAELALVKFTFRNGIEERYHAYLNPGTHKLFIEFSSRVHSFIFHWTSFRGVGLCCWCKSPLGQYAQNADTTVRNGRIQFPGSVSQNLETTCGRSKQVPIRRWQTICFHIHWRWCNRRGQHSHVEVIHDAAVKQRFTDWHLPIVTSLLHFDDKSIRNWSFPKNWQYFHCSHVVVTWSVWAPQWLQLRTSWEGRCMRSLCAIEGDTVGIFDGKTSVRFVGLQFSERQAPAYASWDAINPSIYAKFVRVWCGGKRSQRIPLVKLIIHRF